MDTHAGQAWIGLRVMLGPGPMKYTKKKPQKQHRSPSYLRRQERRKAARLAAEVSCNQNDDCKEASKSELTEEVSEVPKDDNADTKETEEVQPAEYICEICDFVTNKDSGVRIHMSKKHVTIEQLDGNVEDVESDPESECASEEYDISKDPNYELRTYSSYASCECCTFSAVKCGRKVSKAWISKSTPRWKSQILPFKPGFYHSNLDFFLNNFHFFITYHAKSF